MPYQNSYRFASEMVPGNTYLGTSDGPIDLQGVHFTVLTMVCFDPVDWKVPTELSEVTLIQVQYDAWAYPLPQSACFAHNDLVMLIGEE